MAVKTPNSSKRAPMPSFRAGSLQAGPPSPIANNTGNNISRPRTPKLPTQEQDTSPSPGSSDGNMLQDEPDDDVESQETAIVPDSAQATPIALLPGLSSSAIQRMDAMYAEIVKKDEPASPSKLSQECLKALQNDLRMDESATLADIIVPLDGDCISLQSDLTVADLDPNDWKETAISYGAEPRSDDENGSVRSDSNTSKTSRRRKTSVLSLSPRKAARASPRLEAKVLTPSKSACTNVAAITPAKSAGRKATMYSKPGYRTDTGTSSGVDFHSKSHHTSGTTSAESSGVAVTTAKKAGVLRQITPDGTILDSTYASTPSKVYSDSKGKGRGAEMDSDLEDNDVLGLGAAIFSPRSISKEKSPEKGRHCHVRTIRTAKKAPVEIEKSRIRTPSLSPPKEAPVPFIPLSTATDGKGLSAMEIIAHMRAKNKAGGDSEVDKNEAQEEVAESDSSMHLPSTSNLLKKSADMPEDDSDEDDLMDPTELLNKAKNALRRPKEPPPVISTSTVVQGESSAGPANKKVRLPKDKASQALDRMFKSRQAEAARGWFGMDEALRTEAEVSRRSTSTSPQKARAAGSEGDSGDSDRSDSSSLPDAPSIAIQKEGTSEPRPKKARRYSNGQMKRVVGHLTKSKEDERVVKAIKAAQDELEEAKLRAQRRREQEKLQFWKNADSEDFMIEPFKPYEVANAKGLDYSLRKGVIAGLADPMDFPVELVSPYLTSQTALLSSIPAAYSLYRLVAHPCTDVRLANRVLPLLQTLLRRIPAGGSLDVDIDLSSIVDSLNAMQAKKDSFTDEMRSSAAIENTHEAVAVEGVEKIRFSVQQRQMATARILLVLQALLDTRRIEVTDYPTLINLLLRMALDTSDPHMRDAATRCLHNRLAQLDEQDVLLFNVRVLFNSVQSLSFRERYVVLSFLPLDTKDQRTLVRSLCYRLLFPSESVELVTGRSTLSVLSSTLAKRPILSIFYITSITDDTSLYYAVLMLQYLLTDLSKYFIEDIYSDDAFICRRALRARDDAQSVIASLADIDSKIRTDVRSGNPMRNKAKNALARTQHTLEYHLQSAKVRADKVSLQRRLGQRTLAEPIEGKVGQGQIAINSYFSKAGVAEKPRPTAHGIS